MAIILTPGMDDVGSDLPWFWRVSITCPRCSCVFRLTPEETSIGPVAANLGTTRTLSLGWRQVTESATPLVAATDGANLHVDPAQVYGPCPYCGYNPIVVRGPRYGLAKTALAVDPAVGGLQAAVAAGAANVSFFATDVGTTVGVLLLAGNAPFQLDATGTTARAITRNLDGTLDAYSFYPLATPARRLTPAAAHARDDALASLCERLGLVLV